MSLRLRCRSCQAAFVTSEEMVGQSVDCPKCGAPQVVPKMKPEGDSSTVEDPPLRRMTGPSGVPAASPAAKGSVFIAKKKKDKDEPKSSSKGLWAGLILLTLVGVGAVIGWPALMKWMDPRPETPVEAAAYDYLKALKEEDTATVARLGVVEAPPSIRSFRDIKRDKPRDVQLKGSFKPIAAMHRAIEKKFDYDQATGRFTPKHPLGTAAETLDALHEAKEKAEKNKTYEKMASGDPNEAMDGAIEFGNVFTKLSEGILSPKKLIPSYKMLVQNAKPALPEIEKALALDYASHREPWDGLLKRPFPTLKADGPFVYQKAEVNVQVQDKLASSGDPPTTLRLKLVRFQMDAIDTKWRVVSARRITPGTPDAPEDEEGPEPEIPSEPTKPSPGDIPGIPTLNPDGLPADPPK